MKFSDLIKKNCALGNAAPQTRRFQAAYFRCDCMRTFTERFCIAFLCILLVAATAAPLSGFPVYAAEEEAAEKPDWKMIDHIDLPGGWERAFYDRLTEEAEDGALVDVSKGTLSYGARVLPVMTFSGTAGSPSAVENESIARLDEEIPQMDLVIMAFFYDHPEIFWINMYDAMYNVSWQWQETGGGYAYNATLELILQDQDYDFRYPEFRTPEAIQEGIRIRDEKAAEILEQAKDMDAADKIQFFDQYLTSSNQYFIGDLEDYDAVPSKSKACLSALEGCRGAEGPICAGYATAFKLLCDRSGIPCISVHGIGASSDGSSESHLWNNVWLEGNWYGTDVTWDDADFSFDDGSTLNVENQDYLLTGSESVIDGMTFDASHTSMEDVDYPLLSPTRYETSPFPYILEMDGQVNGYYNLENMQNGLKDLARKAAAQNTILVNGSMEVDKSVLDSIRNKNVTLCFQDEKHGLSWSVNGESVTKGYQTTNRIAARNLLFERSDLKQAIYAATGRRAFLHIRSHTPQENQLGYTAELSIDLKTENAGLYVTHFYYDRDENALDFISSEQIPADGIIRFTTKETIDDIFTVTSQPLDESCLKKWNIDPRQ